MKHPRGALRADAGGGANSWQNITLMHSRRSPGQEKRPFAARYRHHAFEMSWFWQDMLPMYSKCPAKRRLGIHLAGILPSRRPFAVRIPQIMHDERILPRSTDPAGRTLPRSTDPAGRILSRSMAPLDESYRAQWFLSCKSCHPALAAPVGQIPLGRVRLMKPTAFASASAIVISTNALWGKAPE